MFTAFGFCYLENFVYLCSIPIIDNLKQYDNDKESAPDARRHLDL